MTKLTGKQRKLLERVMSGRSDANISFSETRGLLSALGFGVRVKGSHHVFSKEGVEELINLQPTKGGKCHPYQVRQMRRVLKDNELA
jgi:predicted RNA binding protein YcfA (HicA-like mRNA interferase family)